MAVARELEQETRFSSTVDGLVELFLNDVDTDRGGGRKQPDR